MNDYDKAQPPDEDQLVIERLVDGELGEEQRKELLSSLDATPNGWRQLALAFVEAQTLRQELGAMVSGPPPAVPAGQSPARGSFWLRPAAMALAMAASFLAAVSLGLIFRSPSQRPADNLSVARPPLPATPVGEGSDWRNGPADGLGDDLADGRFESQFAEQPPDGVGQPLRAVATVDLPLEHEAETSLVLSSSGHSSAEDVWSRVRQPALPPHIRQLLEQLGHQLRVRRSVVPLDLPDGRRAVLPMEIIDVQPVGEGNYQ